MPKSEYVPIGTRRRCHKKADYSRTGLSEVLTPRLWNLAEIEQLFFVRSPGLNGATLQPTFAKVDLLESRDNHSSRSQRALETSEQNLPSLDSNRIQVPGKSDNRTIGFEPISLWLRLSRMTFEHREIAWDNP